MSWYTLQLSLTNKPGKWYRQRREKVPLCWRPPVASWKTFDPSQWGASTVEWTLMTNRQVHSMEYACAWVWPSTIIVLDQYRKLKPTLPSRALVTRFVGTLLEVRHWRAVILLGMVNYYGQFNSEPVYLEWTIICQQTNKQTNMFHGNKKPIRSFFCHLITCLEDFQNERLSSHMLSLNPNKCKSLLKRFLPTIVNGWISTGWYNSFLKLLGRPSCVIVYSYVVKCILLLPRKKMSV